MNQATGDDVWFHISQCVDNLTPLDDDVVRFDLAPSIKKPGTVAAVNITGGTGNAQRPSPAPHTRAPGGNADTGDGTTGYQ
eukprot:2062842-Heterocapsa_arctica.AAC.1